MKTGLKFLAFHKLSVPFFLMSLLNCLFIHEKLCREFENFDGMLSAKISSVYSIKTLPMYHVRIIS